MFKILAERFKGKFQVWAGHLHSRMRHVENMSKSTQPRGNARRVNKVCYLPVLLRYGPHGVNVRLSLLQLISQEVYQRLSRLQ